MTPRELCEVIDLAVREWHEVARAHDVKGCNCFRAEFGAVAIKRYGFSDKEMIDAWKEGVDE